MRVHSNEHIAFSSNRAARNNTNISKSLDRLSSGLKAGKGEQNASGIATGEKMRAQIRGLSQAQHNMNDGLSALETMYDKLRSNGYSPTG